MVTARSRRTAASEGRLPEVQAPSPDVDIVHTSAVYFIGAGGTERYLATPMGDHTSSGTDPVDHAAARRHPGHGQA